ncbi:hypothetical protein [Maridesulfovibrio bastinii]|uniref:hypothetical protein n=1 Tax=Maridesulfovibrio bastinii TaxID=47157 RepID=UPI0004022695|nr:hypothetical protein [Maridesulfovibrio bastinii]
MGLDLKIGAASANQIDSSAFKIHTAETDSAEKEAKDLKIKTKDSVSISAEGLAKSAKKTTSEESSQEDQTVKMLREKIKEIEKELKELRQNPEQNKKAIKMKEQELQQYQGMLMDILNKKKGATGGGQLGAAGGTPVKGNPSSLT